ncbi:MAG: GTPase Era [Alphaproteobacteria bacterium]|nr:GTPase Era [Alphaproteobacteria bacterium]
MIDQEKKRAGYLAIVGQTNAGKSTLLNALVGSRIASVSHKVQTTSVCLTGIVSYGNAQIVLIDTPGIFHATANTRGQSVLMRHVLYGVEQSNAVLLMVDGQKPLNEKVLNHLRDLKASKDTYLAINKIDAIHGKEALLPLIEAYNKAYDFKETFLISSLRNKGVAEMMRRIASLMPEHPWLYADDYLTTMAGKELAAEALRGFIFQRFNKEIPYETTIKVLSWNRNDDNVVVIEMLIAVKTISHKRILLGDKGSGIAYLRERTQARLQGVLGEKVRVVLTIQMNK